MSLIDSLDDGVGPAAKVEECPCQPAKKARLCAKGMERTLGRAGGEADGIIVMGTPL